MPIRHAVKEEDHSVKAAKGIALGQQIHGQPEAIQPVAGQYHENSFHCQHRYFEASLAKASSSIVSLHPEGVLKMRACVCNVPCEPNDLSNEYSLY